MKPQLKRPWVAIDTYTRLLLIQGSSDASTPWCCSSRLCSICRNELLLCVSVYVSFPALWCVVLIHPPVHIMQSMPYFVKVATLSHHFVDYAISNKLTPFISMQNHYNLAYREEEREMFPTLKVREISSSKYIHDYWLVRSTTALALSLGPHLPEVT